MSFDLAISPAGDLMFSPADLVFSPSADLQGVSGTALIEQRIVTRLKVARGSWTYDESGDFGSQLYRLTGMSPITAQVQANSYVREALRDMDDISIDAVNISLSGSSLVLIIDYTIQDVTVSTADESQQQFEMVIGGSPPGGDV